MPHETPLIATIVAGLGLAFVFGALANRFKLPPLVGYLVAGVLVGPHTPGFVADQQLALELAEIGVILLMFGVGLHFSLKDLLSVRAIAVPGAIVQIAFATAARRRHLPGSWAGPRRRPGVRPGAVGRQHRRAAARAAGAPPDRDRARPHRRRLADRRGLAMVLALVLLPALAGVLGGSRAERAGPSRSAVAAVRLRHLRASSG